MSENKRPHRDPKLGTLKKISAPDNVAIRRKIVGPMIIALFLVAAVWLALRPESSQLDV